MRKTKYTDGMVTLEACVSVMIFMILMLIILGFFQMYMAQNATAHCVVETTESLSLDSYATSKLKSSEWSDDVGTHISDLVTGLFGNAEENPNFVTDTAWYEGKGDIELENIIKTRFVGYLTSGDEEKADKFLRSVRVVDGLDGLDFSDSTIVNGDLRVVLKYELEYSFRTWGLSTVDVVQRSVSKMWAENAEAINLD